MFQRYIEITKPDGTKKVYKVHENYDGMLYYTISMSDGSLKRVQVREKDTYLSSDIDVTRKRSKQYKNLNIPRKSNKDELLKYLSEPYEEKLPVMSEMQNIPKSTDGNLAYYILTNKDLRSVIFNSFGPNDVKMKDWTDFFKAIELGYLDVLKWHHENRNLHITSEMMDMAAKCGNLDIVMWMSNVSTENFRNAMDLAAENGHLNILSWLHENRPEVVCTFNAMDKAAEKGYLHILMWLYDNTDAIHSKNILEKAAFNGQLMVVKWLEENISSYFREETLNLVAQKGYLDILKWFYDRDLRCTVEGFFQAAKFNHVNVIEWIYNNSSIVISSENFSADLVASNGSLDSLIWLHENIDFLEMTSLSMDFAAAKGHLSVVKWLNDNRTEGCSDNILYICSIGSGCTLEIVKWLCENRKECQNYNAISRGLLTPSNFEPDIIEYLRTKLLEYEEEAVEQEITENMQNQNEDSEEEQEDSEEEED